MTSGSNSNNELYAALEKATSRITELESQIDLDTKIRGDIREIEGKYKFIVNAYGELMTLINREYVYELVNDALCKAFGKSREDFIGKTIAEVWGKEKFRKEIKGKVDQCFNGDIFKEEDTFMIPGGERRYYAVTYYPYHNEQKEITHIVGVTNDITERKKSEEKLRILNEQKDQYLRIINSDLEQASNYVNSLLPDPIDSPHIKIQWKIVPSVQLGGDSFGYHWIDENHFAIYILDVAGHGIDAALHSVSALNTLKFQNLKNTDFRKPGEVLKGLNNVFQMTDHSANFITMWYAVYDPCKGEIECAGAGHPPILIYKDKAKPVWIDSQNVMLGVVENYNFTSDRFKVGGKTVMYLYTDGAYEVKLPDGNMMSIQDMESFLSTHQNEQGKEMDTLYEKLVKLNREGKLEDDFTILKVNMR
ncbi:SpoIIE family protein phosphatase [Bacteroidota bacterium]